METWRRCWREAVAPQLSTAGLQALARALTEDDPRLLQGGTTAPPPLLCMDFEPCTGGCPIAYAGWQGDGLATVGAVSERFGRVCEEIDRHFGVPTACAWFLSWWDDATRQHARPLLLAEAQRALALRHPETTTTPQEDAT